MADVVSGFMCSEIMCSHCSPHYTLCLLKFSALRFLCLLSAVACMLRLLESQLLTLTPNVTVVTRADLSLETSRRKLHGEDTGKGTGATRRLGGLVNNPGSLHLVGWEEGYQGDRTRYVTSLWGPTVFWIYHLSSYLSLWFFVEGLTF